MMNDAEIERRLWAKTVLEGSASNRMLVMSNTSAEREEIVAMTNLLDYQSKYEPIYSNPTVSLSVQILGNCAEKLSKSIAALTPEVQDTFLTTAGLLRARIETIPDIPGCYMENDMRRVIRCRLVAEIHSLETEIPEEIRRVREACHEACEQLFLLEVYLVATGDEVRKGYGEVSAVCARLNALEEQHHWATCA